MAIVRALLLALLLLPRGAAAQTLDVAVAANLRLAFEELAAGFGRDSGIAVRGAYGSSGKLYAQIRQGAPFHLFLSADEDYPRRLFEHGQALAAPRVYALGVLVVWSLQDFDLARWPEVMAGPGVRHVALPSARSAPYGRAALQALRHHALEQVLAAKLVTGESVAQAGQFVASGNAEIGFTARSLVLGARLPGPVHWHEVAADAYAPIAQAAVLLRHAAQSEPRAARRLFDHLQSPAARTVFAAHGYRLP